MNKSIESQLIGNGQIFKEAQQAKRSLTYGERNRIISVRMQAEAMGLSLQHRKSLEWEGELGAKGITHMPTTARYIGSQDLGDVSLRLYNIEGDHVLNNSTVSVTTLALNGIKPSDLGWLQMAGEIIKENKFMFIVWCEGLMDTATKLLKGGR